MGLISRQWPGLVLFAALASCSSVNSAGTGSEETGLSTSDTTPTASATDSQTTGPTSQTGETSSTTDASKFDLGFAPDIGLPDDGGAVPPSCENIDEFVATSVGCEFFAVEVPSNFSPLPYGISVGNPSMDPATVTIEDMRGPGGTLREIVTFQLQPRESELTEINGQGGLLAEDHMITPGGLNAKSAFRITSDQPVVAMQLFPVGGGPSHVAEASLLLPVNALDTSYLAVGYQHYSSSDGYIVVVATEDATTVMTTQGDVMLDQFDSWYFANGNDAMGFFVGSDKPVAVFSGTTCAMIPGLPWYACDHIEEQVVPLAAWGKSYVAPRHPHRVPNLNPQPEEVYWRVVAAVDATVITLDPPVTGVGDTINLANIGDFFEFNTPDNFTATSDEPFMLVQFMSGCYNVIKETNQPSACNQGPTGDPYMIQVVPVEQWVTSLPFLTDTSYPRDFVIIMRVAGTEVTLDCLGIVPDDHFVAIPGTIYEVGSVDLDIAGMGGEGNCVDGEQFLTATEPIGVLVGGVDWATSYGYPGGLSLGDLWVPPNEPPG